MITASQKELKEAIRLGIRPCGFCKRKRTDKCEVEPAIIVTNRFNKVPNLKRFYFLPCPPASLKDNLLKLVDSFFNEKVFDPEIIKIDKSEYQRVILQHIRPCVICNNEESDMCQFCSSEDIQLDLLAIVEEVFKRYKT